MQIVIYLLKHRGASLSLAGKWALKYSYVHNGTTLGSYNIIIIFLIKENEELVD